MFIFWTYCYHWQPSLVPLSSPISMCLNEEFRGDKSASKSNKLIVFSSAELQHEDRQGGSWTLWLICCWSFPQTDARSVCMCVCVFLRMSSIYIGIAGAEADSQSSDDIFISSLLFCPLSDSFAAGEWRQRPVAAGWLNISSYTPRRSGATVALLENRFAWRNRDKSWKMNWVQTKKLRTAFYENRFMRRLLVGCSGCTYSKKWEINLHKRLTSTSKPCFFLKATSSAHLTVWRLPDFPVISKVWTISFRPFEAHFIFVFGQWKLPPVSFKYDDNDKKILYIYFYSKYRPKLTWISSTTRKQRWTIKFLTLSICLSLC